MVLGLCEMFHCLPSQLDEESAELLKLVAIKQMGTKDKNAPDDPGEEEVE